MECVPRREPQATKQERCSSVELEGCRGMECVPRREPQATNQEIYFVER